MHTVSRVVVFQGVEALIRVTRTARFCHAQKSIVLYYRGVQGSSLLSHHRRLTAIALNFQGGQQVTYGNTREQVALRGGLFCVYGAPAGKFSFSRVRLIADMILYASAEEVRVLASVASSGTHDDHALDNSVLQPETAAPYGNRAIPLEISLYCSLLYKA